MNKSMYSLILMDDVVREIDKIALRMNTNRSNLVNQILAEYASMMTPEKRIFIHQKISKDRGKRAISMGFTMMHHCCLMMTRSILHMETQMYISPS